jgi:signal transduction histidine kinase
VNDDNAQPLGLWQQTWRLAAAAAVGAIIWLITGVMLERVSEAGTGSWFFIGDPLVALGCLTALLWRRRYPFIVATTVVIASTVSALATGAALMALGSVSTRRRSVETGAVVLAYLVASQFASGLYSVRSTPGSFWLQLAMLVLTAGIVVAAGTALGSRRAEVLSLRDRAESAEREQTARAAQTRAVERNRIAREMHDVLAHRISLVAMQAGVLNHRRDLSAEENGVLVRGIAEGSHQALEELRDVLGVLRSDPDHPEPPQPSLQRIPDLVADARTSGLDVMLTTTVTGTPPDTVGRTCYRIVQEGLTNAAKHAPGARIHIALEGAAGDRLDVSVRNGPGVAEGALPLHSGFGLLGLTERVDLVGGALGHRPTSDGGYLLTAHLPWPNLTDEKRT